MYIWIIKTNGVIVFIKAYFIKLLYIILTLYDIYNILLLYYKLINPLESRRIPHDH